MKGVTPEEVGPSPSSGIDNGPEFCTEKRQDIQTESTEGPSKGNDFMTKDGMVQDEGGFENNGNLSGKQLVGG